MPKLKAVRENLDGLTDAQKELYVESDDGKFRLDAEGVEDVGGLKSALDKERRERKELDKKLKKFGDLDPEEIDGLLEAKEQVANAEQNAEQKFEREKKKWEKEKEQFEAKVLARDKKIHELVAENVAKTAIEDAGGRPKVLLPHVLKSTRVVEEDGDFVAVVVDEKGNERTGKGEKRFSLDDLVLELKADDEFASAFNGTGASGTGAPPTGGRGTPPAGGERVTQSDIETSKRRTGAYAI